MFRKWRLERNTTKLKGLHHVNDVPKSSDLSIMVVWKLTAISKNISKEFKSQLLFTQWAAYSYASRQLEWLAFIKLLPKYLCS